MASNSSSERVAVVICTGSYHTPAPYEPFMKALVSSGLFEAYFPQRPTCDLNKLNVGDIDHPDLDRGPPPEGYPTDLDDMAVFHQLLERLVVREGKPVILLGHSSGGVIATQAAMPELLYKTRHAQGHSGGVIGLFYVGAFLVPVGESAHSFFQPKDGTPVIRPFVRVSRSSHPAASRILERGRDGGEDERWAATLTASPLNTGVLSNDGYSAMPCAYVVLDDDACLPQIYQENMIALQSQRGNVFTVYHAPSGHSPHLAGQNRWSTRWLISCIRFVEWRFPSMNKVNVSLNGCI
ncbi:alpha/beta hydrolase [Aspergillus affinis]|uniref:alpha/beta hydrolase n=1 Tax=Aspergillus affinis TaxID=1070780 RepID=UPI0022FE6994|nr:uncharacterized protein KD926_006758 [Aspergillus affinis]KAI9041520.1 hypothetical protein KD926_006758 [Aspergillus affinis]